MSSFPNDAWLSKKKIYFSHHPQTASSFVIPKARCLAAKLVNQHVAIGLIQLPFSSYQKVLCN
jgi:hypothetical protein